MGASLNPLAGKPAPRNSLVDVPRLITAYYSERPDVSVASQKVAFGTSGHRGSSFESSFNEAHVLAITQAICAYRKQQGTTGPLFLGADSHALSAPAFASFLTERHAGLFPAPSAVFNSNAARGSPPG